MGFRLQQKDQNHTAINDCYLTCSQVGAKDAVNPAILDCIYLNVEKKML